MRSRWTLRIRLTVLVLAALLPMMALTAWFAKRDMDTALGLSHSQLRFAASLVANRHERMVQSTQQLLAAAGNAPGIGAASPAACDAYFAQLRERYPAYANLGLTDAEGAVTCHANSAAGGFSIGDRAYFQQAVRQKRFNVGEPLTGRSSGQPLVPFALPVVEDGKVVRVAFAALDLRTASAELAGAHVPAGARVMILDPAGRVVLEHPPREGRPLGRRITNEKVVALLGRREAASGESVDSGGEERAFAVAPAQFAGAPEYVALVSLPLARITAMTSQRFAEELVWLAGTLLLGLAAAWLVAGRMVLSPTRQLLDAVRRLEQGSLDTRVPLERHRRSEFGRLAQAFNRMAESLQARQRELESELGRSRRAYSVLDTVLNTMDEGVLAVDPTGLVLMHNRAAARVFPLAGDMPPPMDWPEHFGLHRPDDSGLWAPDEMPFARAVRGETGVMVVLARNRLVPGGRVLRCAYQPMKNATEQTSGGLVVFTDVTDLQQARLDVTDLQAVERALRDSNQELEAFSYSVSHDLRAPLGAIGGFSKALAERLPADSDPKLQHYLARVQAGVVRMEQLIEALLSLSRVTRAELHLVDVDLSQLAHETAEALHQQDPERRVDVRIEDGLVARGDMRLLRALVDNLVGNAWKFTAQAAEPSIEVGRDADTGAFFVRDNGVGFDMAHAGKLFSAFQRLHSEAEFPGTGIGLATVRRIVARHQGRVWAESQPGAGTTVYFELGD